MPLPTIPEKDPEPTTKKQARISFQRDHVVDAFAELPLFLRLKLILFCFSIYYYLTMLLLLYYYYYLTFLQYITI